MVNIQYILVSCMFLCKTSTTGKMSFEEYEKIVATNPDVLSHLSLNISNIISEYSTIQETQSDATG